MAQIEIRLPKMGDSITILQNNVHRLFPPGYQNFYSDYSQFKEGPTSFYGSYNPFSLW